MTIKFLRKLEVVHKEVEGCTQGSWRLSDQMRIAKSITLNDESSVTHSLTHEGMLHRAARAAKNDINPDKDNYDSIKTHQRAFKAYNL